MCVAVVVSCPKKSLQFVSMYDHPISGENLTILLGYIHEVLLTTLMHGTATSWKTLAVMLWTVSVPLQDIKSVMHCSLRLARPMMMNHLTSMHVPHNLGICTISRLRCTFSESWDCVPISRLHIIVARSRDCATIVRNLQIVQIRYPRLARLANFSTKGWKATR